MGQGLFIHTVTLFVVATDEGLVPKVLWCIYIYLFIIVDYQLNKLRKSILLTYSLYRFILVSLYCKIQGFLKVKYKQYFLKLQSGIAFFCENVIF